MQQTPTIHQGRESWTLASVARIEARLRRWNRSLAMGCSIAAPCLGEASLSPAPPQPALVRRSPLLLESPDKRPLKFLALNNIIRQYDVMNAETLPKVKMPNRDGFISKYPEKH